MKKQTHPVYVPTFLTNTVLLTHDRTIAEEMISCYLLLFLKDIGYSGEVHIRCFLANQQGQLRRPDIYLPRYALAIEIDGRTREDWQRRTDDMEPRDRFYKSIGARPPLVIPANWAVSWHKIERLKSELRNFIHTDRLPPRLRNTIVKRIHDGRILAEQKLPGIFNSRGSLAPVFIQDLDERGFKEYRHFGGTRFKLRTKYKQGFNPKNIPLDLSNSDKYVQDIQKSFARRMARADVGLPD